MKNFQEYSDAIRAAFENCAEISDDDLVTLLCEKISCSEDDWALPGNQELCIIEESSDSEELFSIDTVSMLFEILNTKKAKTFELLKSKGFFNYVTIDCYRARREHDAYEDIPEDEIPGKLEQWRQDTDSNFLIDEDDNVFSCYVNRDLSLSFENLDFPTVSENVLSTNGDTLVLVLDRDLFFANDSGNEGEEHCSRGEFGLCSLEENKVSMQLHRKSLV